MTEAAKVMIGEHDFSAFRAAHCQANSPTREILQLSASRWGDFVIVDIMAKRIFAPHGAKHSG